jgi:hypothetical protein
MKEAFHHAIQLSVSEGGVDDRFSGAGRDAAPHPEQSFFSILFPLFPDTMASTGQPSAHNRHPWAMPHAALSINGITSYLGLTIPKSSRRLSCSFGSMGRSRKLSSGTSCERAARFI